MVREENIRGDASKDNLFRLILLLDFNYVIYFFLTIVGVLD